MLMFVFDHIVSVEAFDEEAVSNLAGMYKNGVMKVTQIEVTGDVTATNINPIQWKGMIVAFSGANDAIPPGWGLCDGTQGTPDLRGRFIRMSTDGGSSATNVSYEKALAGAGRGDLLSRIHAHKINQTGGSDYQFMTTHEMPGHTHSITVRNDDFNNRGGNHGNPGWGSADSNELKTVVSTNSTGSNWGHNNQPPYYVLAWIMKL